MIVTDEEGISIEPDVEIITVKPVSVPPPSPPDEEPKTIADVIKSKIKNPLDLPTLSTLQIRLERL